MYSLYFSTYPKHQVTQLHFTRLRQMVPAYFTQLRQTFKLYHSFLFLRGSSSPTRNALFLSLFVSLLTCIVTIRNFYAIFMHFLHRSTSVFDVEAAKFPALQLQRAIKGVSLGRAASFGHALAGVTKVARIYGT